ncbi:uncharacterized protein Z518_04785 [Rhinocladiella mackenziei CBS 650.93]|uniref:Uncharacterized protein n=1 Tax=Rhinocladiella mackenziei CBS 650.93 TaxID=1442369 RepID=A0A0D2IM21_9EURO|nr:uncharacterized protein Z518_04785 [Rhinocladiella mackenziei CBS 650.93]KIX06809.1 hypothetical protein Z518_04785 [Rhinocladiella mackenziei CBS 650.93]
MRRAYIVASRRSDRSLEARVESVRRASEIHQRRTGRSLRVTEQDIINEEMYEEEDDDLPLPYHRLTTHLQTEFGRFQSTIGCLFDEPSGNAKRNGTDDPTSPSGSVPPGPFNHRRMSTTASLQHGDISTDHQISTDGMKMDSEYLRRTPFTIFPSVGATSFSPLWEDMGPFTTSLPPRCQQMIAQAPGFDPNEPAYAMLIRGSDQYVSNLYDPWQDMRGGVKSMLGQIVNGAQNTNPDSKPKTIAAHPSLGQNDYDQNDLPTAGLDFNFSLENKGLDFAGGGVNWPLVQIRSRLQERNSWIFSS